MDDLILYENSVLKYLDREDYLRVLWIDVNSNSCYVINPFSSKIDIWIMDKNDLISDINKKNIIFVEDPFKRLYDYKALKDKEKSLLDNACRIIQHIASLEREPDCYDRKKRRLLVIEASEKYKVSEKTVYKYLRKYWQGGKVSGALLSDFHKCGSPGNKKPSDGAKRGRPRKQTYEDGIPRGINIDEEILEIFRKSLKKHYMKSNRISLKKTYDLMLKDYFTKDVGGKKIIKGVNDIPSLSQFKNWYYTSVELMEVIESRIGTINTRANYKNLNSDSIYESSYPGYRYQIDATIGDIYLVNRIDRSEVIGRPVVYLVVDTYSRMITGLNISLEDPSWSGAADAIYNCIEDKVEYCKKYGIDIDKSDWNVEGLPSVILGDRGEMVSTLSEGLILLGISIENTPSYMGCAKGIVEQYFNVINNETKAWLPGEVKKDYKERGSRDYKKDATLDIEQFTKIIILAVLKRNKDMLSNYPLSQGMINDAVRPIPNEIWNWGMRNNKGKLRVVSKDILMASLMRKGRATVLREGIKFNNTFYTSEKAEDENWFNRAYAKGSWKVDIVYDRRNMNNIYIKDLKGQYSIRASIKERTSWYGVLEGKSYEEIAQYFYEKSKRASDFTDEQNQITLDMNIAIEEIVEEAKSMKSKTKNNVKDIKENRQKEKEALIRERFLSDEVATERILSLGESSLDSEENIDEEKLHIEKVKEILRRG